MAKIKYSALVSDMRNKLNGSVMSKNRYGSYVRNKVTPVNPQSSFQQAARQLLGNLSSSFRDLTANQISAWNAAGVNFPFTDIFGDTKHLTGQTLFVKLNVNLEKIGKPRISNPPVPVGFPEISIDSFNASIVDSELTTLSFKINQATIPAGYTLITYATPGVSRAIKFVKNRFRLISSTTSITGGNVDILDDYVERFGQPLEGEVIHIRVALVSNDSGQQGVPLTAESTVEGP